MTKLNRWLWAVVVGAVFSVAAHAQTRHDGTVWTHATDCTAITTGFLGDLCIELDSEEEYFCQPSAGNCDTAGEWIPQLIDAADVATGTMADARIDGSLEEDEISLANLLEKDIDSLTGQSDIDTAFTFDNVLVDFDGGTAEATLRIANSATLPATCGIGDVYWDTDADTDGSFYVCRAANTWKEVDDDGGTVTPGGDADDVQINDGASGFTGDGGFEYNLAGSTLDLDGTFTLTQSGGVRDTDSILFSHDGSSGLIDNLDGWLDIDVDELRQTGLDSATEWHQLHVTTTDATQTVLTSDRDGTTVIPLTSDSTVAFDALCVGRRTDADNESFGWSATGVADNNAGTSAVVGAIAVRPLAEDTAAWDMAVDIDDTSDTIRFRATGEAAKTVEWSCNVRATELIG